ncbi:MAG: ABC transporter ATP-binding protein [Prevotellaceae bacterium]|nr:ABC transporter ATP-binding protein [Prevotellaceae bacterium]
MIEAKNITKSYGSLQVLKGVDFSASKAQVVSIVGASGAGKTTLLQILGALSLPDTGELFLDDIDLLSLSSNALAEIRNKKIGFVFQFHHLLPEFTALENVSIPGYIAKGKPSEITKRAKELLDFLSLSQRMFHKPSELSGGEQQRVAVARALMNNPSVILADEPSGNLDTQNKIELHKLFFSLRDQMGQTFVVVTHDPSLAAMTDRCLEMKDGLFV